MANNTGGSLVLTTKTNFKALYEGLENVLEKLEGVERSYKDKISTINTNANGISFQGWSDDIATSFSTYIDDFKKDYFNKIETDIVGGNFVDLLKRIDELKEGVGKCATTQDAIDSTEESLRTTDKKVWVKNTNKKKDTDPDKVQVDNPTYTSLVNELNRLKGDLDDELSDCNGILRQIPLIEFGKDYEYTPYQFTDTTLDDAQFQDPNTTTTIEDLGNGQFRKTTTTVMPDGTTIVQVIVYYDRDGNGVPDEGMPYTENTYMEDVPPEGQQQVVDDTLEGTGLDVTVDGETPAGDTPADGDNHPWTTYEDAVGDFPAVMTINEWARWGYEGTSTYQEYLDLLYNKCHPSTDTSSAPIAGGDNHPWQSYEDGAKEDPCIMTWNEWNRHGDKNQYPTYQDYLDAEYNKRHASTETSTTPSLSTPADSNQQGDDDTIHIAGLESAISVDTHDPYDPNFGNTSTEGQVRVVDGTGGETVGQIKLDTTIYGPGGTVEGVQNNGTTTFAFGDNGNSGTLTYDHPDSHFDCNLTYDASNHTVTETVNDNGRVATRTFPYIAETYEISTPSGTYEVTINPNTDAGKLFLRDYVANLASNQDSGQRMGSDLAYDAIAMGDDTTSVSSESLGFTITLKTQEFYRPDGSYASHDFATGETTTLVPSGGGATPSVPSSNPGSSSGDSAGVTDFTGSSGTHHTGSGGSFGDPAVGDAGGGTYTGGGGGGGGTPYYTFTADGGNGLPGPFNK